MGAVSSPAALVVLVLVLFASSARGARRGSPTTTTPAPPPLPAPVDLTAPLDRNSTTWPTDQPFAVTRNTSSTGEFGWTSTQSYSVGGQTGTHLEAPYHLNEHGWKVDEVPLDRLLVSGVLLDVSADAARNISFLLSAEHILAWQKKHGPLPPNSVLLINFGWGSRLRSAGNPAAIPALGPTSPGLALPGVSKEAAELLVSQGRVVGVGVDLPSLDPSRVHGEPAARVLMAANIYFVLNLDLNHDLPAKGFSLLVLPLKVRGAAVAGVRVVATTRSPSPSRSAAGRRHPGAALSLLMCCTLVSWLGPLPLALRRQLGSIDFM